MIDDIFIIGSVIISALLLWYILKVVIPYNAVLKRYSDVVTQTRKWFEGRPVLSPKDFAETYFPEEKRAVAVEIAKIFGETGFTEQDIVSRMMPDDRLVEDLGVGVADGFEMEELVTIIERKFAIEVDEKAVDVITIS